MNALTFDFAIQTAPRKPQTALGKIIVYFAGGGGTCEGIRAALNREIDEAANHDEAACAMHAANHPRTRHHCQSVWAVDPLDVADGQAVDMWWFSPDCKHFSKAKGGKPVEKHIRDLAWVVVHCVERLPVWQRPKVVMLENVEEFRGWGPLVETDKGLMPCPDRKGEEFEKWIARLKKAGYKDIQWRELRACDYGAPTIRKRFFLIARRDSQPIVWPDPTHGDPKSEAVQSGKLLPWRTAAECIDWSIPCPSIFERTRPLKEATCRRIAAGIMRYVVNNPRPFIVPLTHASRPGHGGDRTADINAPFNTVTGANRGEMALVEPFVIPITHTQAKGNGRSAQDPLATITTAKGGEFALVSPHITKFRGGAIGHGADEPLHTVTANSFINRSGGASVFGMVEATLMSPHMMTMRNAGKPFQGADEPAHTVTAEGAHQYLVSAFMAQHNSGFYGGDGRPADAPMSTVTQSGSQQSVAVSHLTKLYGTCADGAPVDEPMPTVTAGGMHIGEVRAFLVKYYGSDQDPRLEEPMHTVTTKDRFGLVEVMINGEPYVITDIGMRMLTPRELARAQGFPDSYILDPVCDYKTDAGNMKHGPLPKSQQIAKIGNSVCPAMAEALTRANCGMYAGPAHAALNP